MTRESKVGLLVASSFLILVGIVVASKLKTEEDPTKTVSVSPAHEQKGSEQPKPTPPAPPAKGSEHDKPAVAPATPDPMIDRLKTAVAQQHSPMQDTTTVVPPPAPTSEGKDAAIPPIPMPASNAFRDLANQNAVTPAAMPVLPPTTNEQPKTLAFPPADKKQDPPMLPAFAEIKKTAEPMLPPAHEKKDNTLAFPPIEPKKDNNAHTFPLIEPKKDAPAFPPVQAQDGGPTFPALPALKDDHKLPVSPVTANPNNGLPTSPTAKQDAVIPPPNTFVLPPAAKKEPSIAPLTNAAQPEFPKDQAPAFQPQAPFEIPTAKKEIPAPAPLNISPNNMTKPGLGTTTPLPIPPGGVQVVPTPFVTTNPNNGNSALPTIGVAGAKPFPMPVEHVMNKTTSGVGETNFAQLSTRLYGSDKYADALYAYNRAHVDANVNPSIAPGQTLAYPSTPEYLANTYPSLIRNASPPTIPPAVQNVPAVTLVRPAPAPTSPIAAVSNPPAGQGRSYVVQSAGGERIRDIAQRALGSADRWFEIYRINQSLNLQPQFPLPAGTRLQLPAN